ncbi:hypothetical protein KUA25_06085 [Bacteroidales bacterium MSK.15.36]|nr:hypothetical protein [Bacteroidales bacterium MSK.15.36]
MIKSIDNEVFIDMLPEGHKQIASTIGINAFVALCKDYGGATLYIPKIDGLERIVRDAMIKEDYKNGMSYKEIREKYKLSETHIRRILEEEAIQGQLSIFD